MTTTQISAQQVNELRKRTGAGLMDCKKALLEAAGDVDEAITILKKKGIASAAKKALREASEGTIQSYIHMGGRVGVLLELNCETDFVAKNEEFQQLAKDISMHIAAASPAYCRREDVPANIVDKEKEIAREQAAGKPEQAMEGIINGKLNKFYSQVCLLEQEYVKDSSKKVQDVITDAVSKLGENIVLNRFTRYQLGE